MRKHVRANLSSVHNSSSGAMGKKKKKIKRPELSLRNEGKRWMGEGGRKREVPSEERRAVRSYGTYLRKFRTHGGIAGRAGSAKQFEVLAKCCGK